MTSIEQIKKLNRFDSLEKIVWGETRQLVLNGANLTLKYSSACCSVVGLEGRGCSRFRCRQVFACSLGASGLEADSHLEGVVDPPLETRERANHEDSSAETLPEALEADVGIDLSGGATLLVHDGDHRVSGMGDDSAEDTSEVT